MAGQTVVTTPITPSGGMEQMARQANGNIEALKRALNQRNTTQILYDNDHATARVLLGKTPTGKNYVVAISKEQVDVIKALEADKIDKNNFIFYSETVNEELEKAREELEKTRKELEANRELFKATVEAFWATRDVLNAITALDVEGMENINTNALNAKIDIIESLEVKEETP